jgi:hypothetical protein
MVRSWCSAQTAVSCVWCLQEKHIALMQAQSVLLCCCCFAFNAAGTAGGFARAWQYDWCE